MPPIDEHRERHERQLEVHLVGGDRAEHVDVEPAREPGERTGERERPEPLAVDVDPDRLRRSRILARRAQLAPEPAPLVRERDGDRRPRAPIAACVRSVVSGTSESVVAPGPIFVHSRRTLCVISSTANVAMPAARPESRISGRPTTSAKAPRRAAASTSEGTLPIVLSREHREQVGEHALLRLDRHRSSRPRRTRRRRRS